MVSPGGGGFATIAVFGYNGASSPDPYTLRVTTQAPPGINCTPRTFDRRHRRNGAEHHVVAGNLNTLILVNEKRIGATYGAAAETSVVASLTHLAGDASLGVSGAVIPVEGSPSPSTRLGRQPVRRQTPPTLSRTRSRTRSPRSRHSARASSTSSSRGGDDQIPFFRIPDLSLIANESGFAGQFSNNEYYGALASGDLLTDNPYLDTRPVPASGRQLFIPDLAGGRLVETASEIPNAVTSFETSNGSSAAPRRSSPATTSSATAASSSRRGSGRFSGPLGE